MDTVNLDYDTFCKRVGLLTEEDLKALGWEPDNGYRICGHDLNKLIKFVDNLNNPSNAEKFILGKKLPRKTYHIATELPSDEIEDEFRTKNKIPDEVSVFGTNIVNYIVEDSRLDYYLCDGDANVKLECVEVEKI